MDDQLVILAARQTHIGPHIAHLAETDRAAIEKNAGSPRRFLRSLVSQSSYARSALVGNVPIAMWGVTGTLLSTAGHVWLSATPEARKLPFMFGRVARQEAAMLLSLKYELHSAVLVGDRCAMRFLRFLGFKLGDPMMFSDGKEYRNAVLARPWN